MIQVKSFLKFFQFLCVQLAGGNIVRMEPRAHSLTFGPSQLGSSEKALDARQRQLANKKRVLFCSCLLLLS